MQDVQESRWEGSKIKQTMYIVIVSEKQVVVLLNSRVNIEKDSVYLFGCWIVIHQFVMLSAQINISRDRYAYFD